jgi:hypothetical protein
MTPLVRRMKSSQIDKAGKLFFNQPCLNRRGIELLLVLRRLRTHAFFLRSKLGS